MPNRTAVIHCPNCTGFILRPGSSMPNICKVWEIRTSGHQMPSLSVTRATGKPCPYYTPKTENRSNPQKKTGTHDGEIDLII